MASTTTNLAAVVPFLLITGLSALVFRELIMTISFAILASLPLALTLVPMLAAQLGKVRFQSGLARWRPLLAVESGLERMRQGYRRVATVAVRRRGLVLAGSAVMAVGGFFLLRTLPSTFLPQVDDGTVGVGFRFPSGTPPARANQAALELEQMVAGMPHVVSVFATAGGGGGGWGSGAGRGNLEVRLTPVTERRMSAEEWVREMQRRVDARGFAGARVFVRPPRIRGIRTNQAGADVALTITGDDLRELERLAMEVERRVQGVPGLENLELQAQEAAPQVGIFMDRERLRSLGLDPTTVGQTVRTALSGTIATQYTEGNMEFDVRVQLPRGRFTSAEELAGIAMFPGARGGPPVYLRDVADVREVMGPNEIRRENQNRMLRMNGDVLTEVASISEVTDSVRGRLADMTWPNGYGVIIGGEQESINETNRQMALIIALAIFLVFVVMAVQYESLVDPLVILLAVPLALVGVVVTLWVTGTSVSAPVFLGMILLAGIVVNNSILLVEFIEGFRHEQGVPIEQAVVEAGYVRMRPILMTTLTSMVGSMPLAFGLGQGGEMMRPLAVSVVGGIAFSTIFTLFVIPCAYVVLHGAADRVRAFLFSGAKAQAQVAEAQGD